MSQQIDNVVSEIDTSMKKLRSSMRGIQIRTAGFKRDHDALARGVAEFTVLLIEAEALVNKERTRRRRRR
ncbi:MAG: hypothetical protein LC799_09010 [Actinobacteria bacterium]|nr:hypothetical protein [Actinomycetota bacterium]